MVLVKAKKAKKAKKDPSSGDMAKNVKMSENIKEKIHNVLNEVEVCKLCIINFIGGSNHGIPVLYGDYELDIDEQQPAKEKHCYLCLGILEEFNIWNVAKTIAEKMSDYGSPNFSLGVVVPQSTLLHRLSMVEYIAEKLQMDANTINVNSMALLKNVTKHFLSQFIVKFSKKTLVSNSELFVEINYAYCNDQQELSDIGIALSECKKRKMENNKTKVSFSNLISNLPQSDIKRYSPDYSVANCTFDISVVHANIFVSGQYKKYCRSLEDCAAQNLIIEKIKEVSNSSNVKFVSIGLGRESSGIKILGEGKSFVADLQDPKISILEQEEKLSELMRDINSSETVSLHNLVKVDKTALDLIRKDGDHIKEYLVKLSSSQPITDEDKSKFNDMKEFVVYQATPIRLLHSEPYHTEKVSIYKINMEKKGEYYELSLQVSGKSHVKEFISGDLGRTEPSLKSILDVPFEIIEIDFVGMAKVSSVLN